MHRTECPPLSLRHARHWGQSPARQAAWLCPPPTTVEITSTPEVYHKHWHEFPILLR
jgi:hypothetical protein